MGFYIPPKKSFIFYSLIDNQPATLILCIFLYKSYNEHCITIALDFFRMTMALIQQMSGDIGLHSQDTVCVMNRLVWL
jgi:hypothetical protein